MTTVASSASGLSSQKESSGGPRQSKLYQAILTPINFVTFLVSLYLVDSQYQSQRAAQHHQKPSSSSLSSSFQRLLPAWLHPLLFRPQQQQQQQQPYQWVTAPVSPQRPPSSRHEEQQRWYYHTKQKKLMKMEAADAFELRNTVLVVLCVMGLGAAWGVAWVALGVWGWVVS
ncbi:hypothetical protein F4778DRAFT_105150 [Xylariomycetidae sp. FL2044]|nr:hypothetical protein F4778DRAFT_105150 [Xylariomycetidae sp. FL2044]